MRISRFYIASWFVFWVPVVGHMTACDTDEHVGEQNQSDTGIEFDAAPPSTDPRDPEDLPGSHTEPGADPCDDDSHCHWDARGVDTQRPFRDEDLSGARLDENGVVTLDDEIDESFVAWIPNTEQGTVSKVDTEERIELARYRTGPSDRDLGPSHTAVRGDGGVYVANRDGQSVTRLALTPDCEGASGGDVVTTSTGPDDLLDWGDDDCVVWHRELTGYGQLRGLVAQDDDEALWVGAREDSIWKLDAHTGQILFRTETPIEPGGFALDEGGQLWIAPHHESQLGRLDTTLCRDHESCDVEICEGPDGECIKERMATPERAYGIAIDGEQRIWLGGDLMRFDPAAAPEEQWFFLDPGFPIWGLVFDGDDWIFAAADDQGMYRYLVDNPEQSARISETANRSVRAVDVDHHGSVWGINREHNDAFVVAPGTGLFDGELTDQLAGFDGPDAYSNFTASAVHFPLQQLGLNRQRFEACEAQDHYFTEWQTLRFEAQLEDPARLEWRIRAASSADGLEAAQWQSLGAMPGLSSPVDIRAVLAEQGLARAAIIEIEARLSPGVENGEFFIPQLRTMDVIANCPPIVL